MLLGVLERFRCTCRNGAFLPHEAGHCRNCGKLLCSRHLKRRPGEEPHRSQARAEIATR